MLSIPFRYGGADKTLFCRSRVSEAGRVIEAKESISMLPSRESLQKTNRLHPSIKILL